MTKTHFLKAINALMSIDSEVTKLYGMGIDITESPIIIGAEDIAMTFLSDAYNECGIDWIQWWLYERADNAELKAYDEEGNEILRTLDELYEYVESNCKNV